MVTVGAGANYQQIKATLTNDVNYSGALATAAAQAAAGGLIPPSVDSADRGGSRRARFAGQRQRQRQRLGLEHRPADRA